MNLIADLALAVFTFLLYRSILHAPFVFDDLTILNNSDLLARIDPMTSASLPGITRSHLRLLLHFLTGHTGGVVAWIRARPITRLSYEVNVVVSGLNPYSYHLTSVGIGAGAVVVFRHVLLHFAHPVPAFLGAALLAASPLATMAVSYIAGRSSLLVALWILLAIACYLNGWWGLAVGMVGLAVLTKEEGVVGVPILVCLHYFVKV